MLRDFVTIGEEIDPSRISDQATIHAGCRLIGNKTLVCKGAELGFEAPVTINNCYVGPGVKLKGGYFENAVFLEGVEAGSGSHVRSGTIMEEYSSIAHTVGLKQTILFPYVTLGSLINFCDCLMAGGTSRKNHSEVGSSYIHFNYTPNQDKATASLIGDVPNGVMLTQNPIFLGGQGGLVGPCRVAFGTIIAAGSVFRKDQLIADRLVFSGGGRGGSTPYATGIYTNVRRPSINNLIYMANLVVLMVWYRFVRSKFIGERFQEELFDGLMMTLRAAIDERIKRFVVFCEKLHVSKVLYKEKMGNKASAKLIGQKEELFENRNCVSRVIDRWLNEVDTFTDKVFLSIIDKKIVSFGLNYIDVIQNLDHAESAQGSQWLNGLYHEISSQLGEQFPSIEM